MKFKAKHNTYYKILCKHLDLQFINKTTDTMVYRLVKIFNGKFTEYTPPYLYNGDILVWEKHINTNLKDDLDMEIIELTEVEYLLELI